MTNIKSFWLVLQSFLELLLFTFSLVSRLGFVLLLFWRAWLLLSDCQSPKLVVIFDFAKESVRETKKVVWPTRKEAGQITAVVFGLYWSWRSFSGDG
jgi:hypothetical protein